MSKKRTEEQLNNNNNHQESAPLHATDTESNETDSESEGSQERRRFKVRSEQLAVGPPLYDGVPETKQEREKQQKEFFKVLYGNHNYKPVILFLDK